MSRWIRERLIRACMGGGIGFPWNRPCHCRVPMHGGRRPGVIASRGMPRVVGKARWPIDFELRAFGFGERVTTVFSGVTTAGQRCADRSLRSAEGAKKK